MENEWPQLPNTKPSISFLDKLFTDDWENCDIKIVILKKSKSFCQKFVKEFGLYIWMFNNICNIIFKIINFDDDTRENVKEHYPNWPQIPNHSYRILVTGGSGSWKTNSLLNNTITPFPSQGAK